MRLTTIRHDHTTSAARVDGDTVTLLEAVDVGALLQDPRWRANAMVASGERLPLAEVTFAPLVVAPEKIICVGANYRDHCAEVGIPLPDQPTVFAKFHRALIGANEPLTLPSVSRAIDWEAELGVVIGAAARNVPAADALDVVAGYTIVDDVSMRDWQLRTSQFLQGKTFEASTPVGPFLVTGDEVGDPGHLSVTCDVSGERMQTSNTSQMVFPVEQIIAYISTFITLVPGDLIATGTPGGVGGARTPPRFLADGDVVVVEIEGLGAQHTTCRAEVAGGATVGLGPQRGPLDR